MGIYSHAALGFEGQVIRVECDLRRAIPGIEVVGLAGSAVREARDRVRVALRNSAFDFPNERILINLAPADVKKSGTAFDLPMALGILTASGQAQLDGCDVLAMGELLLSGEVRPVSGVLSAVAAGLQAGIRDFIVPLANLAEARVLPGARIWSLDHLSQAPALLKRLVDGEAPPEAQTGPVAASPPPSPTPGLDLADLRGQPQLRRALEIAAAGGHHLLLFGPPGAGKTMSARLLADLLPDLEGEPRLEVTRLWSLAGQRLPAEGLLTRPPLRAPHHSASEEGLVGGGPNLRPGEVSLAHRGLLFLDECPEFSKSLLQSLREPIEDGRITVARAGRSYDFPARFQLVMAANSCPCGQLGVDDGLCLCPPEEVKRYWDRVGGALLDRIDLKLLVKPTPVAELLGGRGPTTAEVRARVLRARQLQARRQPGEPNRLNAVLTGPEIEQAALRGLETRSYLTRLNNTYALSSRGAYSLLKVARTIADLADSDEVQIPHLEEALALRRPQSPEVFWT